MSSHDFLSPQKEKEEDFVLPPLAISNGVEFSGWLDHRDVHTKLGKAQVFAFPSVREFGGGVVLEAMGMGVVPVVLDHGGPPEFIADGMGYALPIGTREQVIAGFRERLSDLSTRIRDVIAMGQRARAHALKHYTWEAKAKQLHDIYAWVCGDRSEKPKPFEEMERAIANSV